MNYLSLSGVDTAADAVNLFVQLSTMMVSLLTSTGDCELDTGRMPSSDTGNFTETFMSLAGQFACVPTWSDTLTRKKWQTLAIEKRKIEDIMF